MRIVHVFTGAVGLAAMFLLVLFFYAKYEVKSQLALRSLEYKKNSLPNPNENCATPFGTLLGVADNVPAFSNCHRRIETSFAGFASFSDPMDVSENFDAGKEVGKRFMTGQRYLAMEYAIRYMQFNRGVVPRMTPRVQEVWERMEFLNPAKPSQSWSAEWYANYMGAKDIEGRKKVNPRRLECILYAGNADVELPHGHIAVIVKVEDDPSAAASPEAFRELKRQRLHPRKLYLAEQNFENKDWGGRNYSRVARFAWKKTSTGGHEGYVEDDSGLQVIGRVRVGTPLVETPTANAYQEGLDTDAGDL